MHRLLQRLLQKGIPIHCGTSVDCFRRASLTSLGLRRRPWYRMGLSTGHSILPGDAASGGGAKDNKGLWILFKSRWGGEGSSLNCTCLSAPRMYTLKSVSGRTVSPDVLVWVTQGRLLLSFFVVSGCNPASFLNFRTYHRRVNGEHKT